jgi:5-methyltetrahydropteroyltriglutamate--homocysteine methyltransferase
VTIQQNTDHIQSTHIGSLPRPHNLLDLLKAKYAGQPYDESQLNSVLRREVAECVRKQVDCGIEIVTDGEYSKPGFFTYIRERFDGFESRPNQKLILFQQEVSAFPEYYAQYFKEAMMGGAILPIVPVVCIAPVKYKGQAKLQIDIDNVKAAAKAAGVPDPHVFLPATAPLGRRHQRILQKRGRILPRARCRVEQGIPRDRGRRHFGPGRRPFSAGHLC